MRILITGGTGFIGKELVLGLISNGYDIRLLARSADRAADIRLPASSIFVGDVTDFSSVKSAIKGCTHVFHLAAVAKPDVKDPGVFRRVNVEGTRNVLEAALQQGIKRVVFTSTAGIFPATGPDGDAVESGPRQESSQTDYITTKIEAETLCRDYVARGLDVVSVYPSRVFGPGVISTSNAVTKIIRLFLRGRWRMIPGNGKSMGNYVFIDDVVEGHMLAMQKGKSGEGYLLGGENVSFNEMFSILKEVSGKRYFLFRIPYPVMWFVAFLMMVHGKLFRRPAMISPAWVGRYLEHRCISSRKAMEELGYRITPLEKAFEKTIDWLRMRSRKGEASIDETYAVVTGASAGIGRAIAIEWARRGKNLLLVSLPDTGLCELSEELKSIYGISCHCIETNLLEKDTHEVIHDYARSNKLAVNVLINNVGIGYDGPFEDMSEEAIEKMLTLNITVTTMLTRAFLPDFRKMPRAYILNLDSLGAFAPIPGKCVYSASKAYIMYFTKALRRELRGSGIRVSAIFPAGVVTNQAVRRRISQSGLVSKSMVQSVDAVARAGIDGLLRGREVIFPGRMVKAFFHAAWLIPQGLVLYLTEREFRRMKN